MAFVTILIWGLWLAAIVSQTQDFKADKMAKHATQRAQLEDKKIQAYPEKSLAAKQKVMDEDQETMSYYGLYYDYANLTLEETVKAYLDEFGIPHDSIAFSYKNTKTGQIYSMNATQPMTAGSTYKLPLNMLIVDGVRQGKFSMV